MIINQVNLDIAFTGISTIFQTAFDTTPTTYEQLVMSVPSSTKQELHAWLGKVTKFREWVGDRVVQNLATHGFTVVNKHFENTIGINRDDFDDDTYGIYNPTIQQMGIDAKEHPDILVYSMIKNGTSTKCYDGANFLDQNHPSWDANGNPIMVANIDNGGTGPFWYLLDTSKAVKPILYQKRKDYQFIPRTRPDDPSVFDKNEFVFGVDARIAIAPGMWQFIYASNQPLDSVHFAAARAAMMANRVESGDILNVKPNLLMVPPSLKGAANTLMKAQIINQTSNIWMNECDVLEATRLQ